MNRIISAVGCALLTFGALAAFGKIETTPTPRPAVDWSKVPNADAQVEQMIAHRNALHQLLLDQTLPDASADVKSALDKAQVLQKDIDQLAISAAKVPVLEAELKKAHSACWRNLMIGLAGGFVLGFLGPKILKLVSIFA